MSADNYIQIKERSQDKFYVSERFYEGGEIQFLGTFDSMRDAVEKAENYIENSEHGVEYGVRFSLIRQADKNQEIKKINHKDFDAWNKVKKITHERVDSRNVFFDEREVWWCSLGVNVGFEQDGKGDSFQRPVLIVRKFNQFVMLVLPLSTRLKKNKYYIPVKSPDGVDRSVIISQLRLIDIRRLTEKMFVMNEVDFNKIKKAVRELFS